jgi:hypothetical protein
MDEVEKAEGALFLRMGLVSQDRFDHGRPFAGLLLALLERHRMAYAIIRGKNGRRHEVDFGSSPLRAEVHASQARCHGVCGDQ